jgi:hypothetical protein
MNSEEYFIAADFSNFSDFQTFTDFSNHSLRDLQQKNKHGRGRDSEN